MEKKQTSYSAVKGFKDGKPWFATIRDGYESLQTKKGFDWLLEIHISIVGSELPSNTEAVVLNGFEDTLEEELHKLTEVYFLFRTTSNGLRSIYYRISTPELIAEKLNKIIDEKKYPREFEYKIVRDSDWCVTSRVLLHPLV